MSMHKPTSPPATACFPPIDTNSSNSSITNPPRPNIPPGHAGTVRTPHPHDVLSGRGGRINSHPGNVHFREIIDAYKRQYLDPRTKKAEKARIAARIVQAVRTLEPTGRFLKEDPHTGLWMEVGDERAWKKAGQALRESAPEIRAERQMKLQMLAGVGDGVVGMVDPIVAGGGGGSGAGGIGSASRSGGGSKSSGSRKSRQADPPAPRHRPNPPEREGLAAVKRSNSRVNAANNYINNDAELAVPHQQQQRQTSTHSSGSSRQAQQKALDEDAELTRMRQEYYQMQRLQQEQQRRMEQYQTQIQQQQQQQQLGNAGSQGGVGGGGNDRVYDEYNQMQQGLLMGNYRQQIHQEAQAQLAARDRDGQQQQQQGQGQRYQNHQDIAAAIMDDGLLPVNAGFDIPALRGEMPPQQQQQQYQQYLQQQQQQQQHQEQFSPNYNQEDYNNPEAFADRHFNACDKTVSTMSSFDMHQSMDMSSLGGFSWNQSAYNMSGLISTGDNTQTTHSTCYNNYNASGTNMGANNGGRGSTKSKSKSKKSALERKLEKVNRRQQMQEMQCKQQPAQAPQGMMHQGAIEVPTAGGVTHQKQQQQKQNNNNQRSHKYSQENNMASLNSFGFEAIEEDEHSKASEFKMSNLGLSGGLSEMDMTFSSDVMSVRSKSVPKMREKSADGGAGSDNVVNRMASIEDSGSPQKRSSSAGNVDGDINQAGITASSVFNHSLSSASERSASSTSHKSSSMNNNSMNTKNHKSSLNMSMEDFNESFKSMEMEDQRSVLSNKKPLDPDGAVDGPSQRYASGMGHHSQSSPARRKDPRGGRLTTIHSGRGSNSEAHGKSASSNNNADVRLSSNSRRRRTSVESMGISDPDMLNQFGASTASNTDFGVSLGSLQSFQSNDSNASSWLNQYNSMENIEGGGGGSALWDDEDQAQASDGTSMSEISAPRMVTATGGDA